MIYDIALRKTNRGYLDIEIDNNGLLVSENTFFTPLMINLFSDAGVRADEVQAIENRRGVIFDNFVEKKDKIGSRLWLLYQSRMDDDLIGLATEYITEVLEKMKGRYNDLENYNLNCYTIDDTLYAKITLFIKNKKKEDYDLDIYRYGI